MRPRSPLLVSQYLEGVSRKALGKYQAVVREFVGRRHGVYALYRGSKLYYVGLASNLRSRLKSHLEDRHSQAWDRFSVYFTVGDSHLRQLESLVVRVAEPSGNRQKGKLGRAQDLHRAFRRAVRDHERVELDSMFSDSRKRSRGIERDTRRTLELARHLDRPKILRFRYKGKQYQARARTDGWIRFGGRLYKSPSAAAMAVTRRPTNGWAVWSYERAPGDWVPLQTMRR